MEKITYGFYQSPVGEMVIGESSKGLCWLGFMTEGRKGNGLARMKAFFSKAELVQDDHAVQEIGDAIVYAWQNGQELMIPVDMRGTTFQKSVWRELFNIKKGQVKSYSDIANDIGIPQAARAVGTAVGENPISLIVPCHRVLPKSGGVGHYGWGEDVKRDILTKEGVNF